MRVERILPSDEAYALLELVGELGDNELAPRAADCEARGEFPREVVRLLGRAGLLGLPYPEEYGGGGQPYEVYLQVLELLAYRWLAVADREWLRPIVLFGTPAAAEYEAAGFFKWSGSGGERYVWARREVEVALRLADVYPRTAIVELKPRVVVTHPFRGEVEVTLRTPDGRERTARASLLVSHVRGALAPFGIVRLHGVALEDVPAGTEVHGASPL